MTTTRELGEDGARRGGLPNGACSKGWGERCARSHGPKCRCACGGANHGKGSAQLSLGGAPDGRSDRRARFEIVSSDNARVTIRDVGPWDRHPTVTNDAENVVRELSSVLRGRRLFYLDSDERLDELLVREGRFAGFAPGLTNDGLPRVMDFGGGVSVEVGDLIEVKP